MPTYTRECGNADSCRAGATHQFPELGTVVRFKQTTTTKRVGMDENVEVQRGSTGVAIGDVIEEAHQAAIAIGNLIVWADVDDDIEEE